MNKKNKVLFLLLGGCMFFLSGCLEPEKTELTSTNLEELIAEQVLPESYSYTENSVSEGSDRLDYAKGWVTPGKIRKEVHLGKMTYILIGDPNGILYHYDPAKKVALRMDMTQEEIRNKYNPILDHVVRIANSATFAKEEMYNEQATLVYEHMVEYQATGSKSIITTWLNKDQLFPLKIESYPESVKLTITYSDIEVAEFDDSLFELPANGDYKIVDLNAVRDQIKTNDDGTVSVDLSDFEL